MAYFRLPDLETVGGFVGELGDDLAKLSFRQCRVGVIFHDQLGTFRAPATRFHHKGKKWNTPWVLTHFFSPEKVEKPPKNPQNLWKPKQVWKPQPIDVSTSLGTSEMFSDAGIFCECTRP